MKRSIARFLPLLLVIVCLAPCVAAKDEWTRVQSRNFLLVGNAPEKDIRKVATRLEQFRETFRLLFNGISLVSPTPTNVIVFKSGSSYKQFKPKRSDGKIDNFVAGYFQTGQDTNYITLSTEGEDDDTFRTIFHEYVHFIVDTNFGRSEVPPWFNEGLAEYYEMFRIEDDQVVKLGLPNGGQLQLLAQSRLIPLSELFAVRNSQLSESGDHSRSIFYAESWALIHYLMQTGKSAGLGKYLTAVFKNTPQQEAFKAAFGQDYGAMESELRKYVGQATYKYNQITFKNKLTFDNEMTASALTSATANAYLGDLLVHIRREDDAESYLAQALAGEPASAMANTAMGMVKFRQRKFDEARKYLETAIAGDQRNAFALYRYAFLLSREGRDEFGLSREYPPDTIAKMRDALRRAIAAKPEFTESYDMLAWVALVALDNFDEAAAAMQKAVRLKPGDERYSLRLAEVYARQEKFDEAQAIADRVSRTSDDADLLQRSAGLIRNIADIKRHKAELAKWEQLKNDPRMTIAGPNTEPALTPEELDRVNALASLRAMNLELRLPMDGEMRVIGRVTKIDCSRRPIVFTVTRTDGSLALATKDFDSLELKTFVADADMVQIGCDADLSTLNAVVTYKEGPPTIGNKGAKGEIVAIEFVPADFRFMTDAELAKVPQPRLVRREDVDGSGIALPPSKQRSADTTDREGEQREAILRAMKATLRQPAEGEKRDIGFLDKVECGDKGVFFILRTADGSLRLVNGRAQSLGIRYFTPDLAELRIGCGVKAVEYPAVFVYKPSTDGKSQGTILSLEFMPKSFTLD